MKHDVIVKVSVTPKNQVLSVFKQIGKIFAWIKSFFKYFKSNMRDMRTAWGRRKLGKSFSGLFKHAEITADVSIYQLVRAPFKTENMAEFLDDYLNCNMKDQREGKEIGKIEQSTHPTLQASLFRFAVGIIIGLAEGDRYTDQRNAAAITAAKKISQMVESGEINIGYMI